MNRVVALERRVAVPTALLALVLCGAGAWAHGDTHQRITELSQRITAAPRDAALRLQRAELLRQHRQYARAASDLRQARALGLAAAPWHLASARLALDRHDLQAVLHASGQHLQGPARDTAFDEPVLALRAQAHTLAGQHRLAMLDHQARIAAARSPEVDAYLAWAEAAQAADPAASAPALAAIDAGLQRLGPLVVLRQWAVEHLVRQRQWAPALVLQHSLISESPRQEAGLLRQGQIQLLAGQREAARESISAALSAWQQLPAGAQASPAMQALRQRIDLERAALTE